GAALRGPARRDARFRRFIPPASVMAERCGRAPQHEQVRQIHPASAGGPSAQDADRRVRQAGFRLDRARHPLGRHRGRGNRGPFGARKNPMVAAGRRPHAGAGRAGPAGGGPDGDRNPAPLRRGPRAGEPVLRLAGGRGSAAAASPASASRATAAAPRRSRSGRAHRGGALRNHRRKTARRARPVGGGPQAVLTRPAGQDGLPLPHSPFELKRSTWAIHLGNPLGRSIWAKGGPIARISRTMTKDTEANPTVTRRHALLGATAVIAILAAGGASYDLWRPTRTAAAQPAASGGVAVADLLVPGPLGDQIQGQADAPVTIVEYASMTCPHCSHFHETTYPELKKKYIDTGKVRFIFREFPLDALAAAAAMLARCAGNDK